MRDAADLVRDQAHDDFATTTLFLIQGDRPHAGLLACGHFH